MKLKTTILQLYLIFFSTTLLAQYVITIDATVFDKKTRQAIPYVNITFVNKNIKTITDKQGHFKLSYDEYFINKNDTLQFAAFGYKKERVSVQRFYKLLKNTDKIYLFPKGYQANRDFTDTKTSIQKGNIYGRVFFDTIPLQGATVQIKNTFLETQTDNDGSYRIKAQKNDILRFKFLGMKTREVLITDTNMPDVRLKPDAELLNTVVLKGKVGKVEKEEKIDLGFGIKKSHDAIATSLAVLTSKDIGPQYFDFADLLRGRFPGVQIVLKTGSSMPQVWLRGGKDSFQNPTPAIYDIDGVIYTERYPYINPQQIESVAILKSLAASNIYGMLGKGGVVVIRTKTFTGATIASPKKTALVKGNDYTETTPSLKDKTTIPTYLQELKKVKSFKEALKIYRLQTSTKQRGIAYYLNTSDYFRTKNTAFADKILANITQAVYNNATVLKTLAFKYETLKQYNKAKQIYQRIAVLRPKDAQSYRDLALIYQKTENYKEAMAIYKKILTNQIDSVDFSGISQNLTSELKNLLKTHRTKVF
jgi:CarboxypepD_reg-like domain/TonB-dependent Receptor Plug Domain